MFQIKDIDPREAETITHFEESHYGDLKGKDIAPAKLTRFISAFANTAGGEIFLGVEEKHDKTRHWNGFDNMERANAHIQTIEALSPLGGHYRATFLRCKEEKGYVLHIVVFKTRDIIKSSDGGIYIRRNAQIIPVTTEDGIKRLRLDKGIISFEDSTVQVKKFHITNSSKIIEFILNIVPSAEPEEWLIKQNLIVTDMPTVAGLLLFADEPQASLPKRSAIKNYRYKTKGEDVSRETLAFDPITVEGCLYDQIKTAVEQTKAFVEQISRLGEVGLEKVSYPEETLHEIITNAVLHRDYSISSDSHGRIYDNQIEVESPGRLPGHITKDNILNEQSARNPKIVRLIKFPNPPNKDVGEGLNTAFAAMKRLRLKEPEIEERENAVIIHIRHTPLASPQEAVMRYLDGHEEITNSIGRDLTGIRSENAMKNVFLSLKDRKMIEPVPGKRGNASAWRKCADSLGDDPEPGT